MQVWPVAAKMPEIAPFTASSRIGVVEHDVRRFAAELQRHLLEAVAAELVDALAGGVAAGEGDLGDLRMLDQRLADLGAEAGDDVDHARREAGLLDTSCMNSSVDAEVNSDGLMTTVLPAASAGASFQAVSISGEFHGVMIAHDAERLVRVKLKMPGLSIGITAPSILSASPPK